MAFQCIKVRVFEPTVGIEPSQKQKKFDAFLLYQTNASLMCVNNNIDTNRLKSHRYNDKLDTLVEAKIKLVLIKSPVLVCTAPLTLDFK